MGPPPPPGEEKIGKYCASCDVSSMVVGSNFVEICEFGPLPRLNLVFSVI